MLRSSLAPGSRRSRSKGGRYDGYDDDNYDDNDGRGAAWSARARVRELRRARVVRANVTDHLTTNPERRLFQVSQRSFAPFRVDRVLVDFSGPLGVRGSRVAACTITAGNTPGALLSRMYLVVQLPAASKLDVYDAAGRVAARFSYVRDLGFAMIKSVTLAINGTRLDTHDGAYMRARAELVVSDDRARSLEDLAGAGAHLPEARTRPVTLHVPLQFFMCESPRAALPIPASSEVTVGVEFRPFEELLTVEVDGAPPDEDPVSVPGNGGPGMPVVTYAGLRGMAADTQQPLSERVRYIATFLGRGSESFDVTSAHVEASTVSIGDAEARGLVQDGWRLFAERAHLQRQAVARDQTTVRVDLACNFDVAELAWYFLRDEDVHEHNDRTALTDAVRSASLYFNSQSVVPRRSGREYDRVMRFETGRRPPEGTDVAAAARRRVVYAHPFCVSPRNLLDPSGLVNMRDSRPTLVVEMEPWAGAGTLVIAARHLSLLQLNGGQFSFSDDFIM